MINISSRSTKAFTLVEMIVALAVFSMVAVVALGALVKIISANNKAQTLQAAMTNLNFALESMSREFRVGASHYCTFGAGSSIPSTLSATSPCGLISDNPTVAVIAFNSTKIDPTKTCRLIFAYRLNPYTLDSGDTAYHLEKAEQSACSEELGLFSEITDPNVIITNYSIGLYAHVYPLVFLKLSGYAGVKEKERTYFDLQTAVSPRVPN